MCIRDRHEIACHGVTHRHPRQMNQTEWLREVWQDRLTLEELTGGIVPVSYTHLGASAEITNIENDFLVTGEAAMAWVAANQFPTMYNVDVYKRQLPKALHPLLQTLLPPAMKKLTCAWHGGVLRTAMTAPSRPSSCMNPCTRT